MSVHSTGLSDTEPLVVSPRRAAYLLGCGVTRLYELMAAQELESYRDGAARRITTRSIHALVERRLAAAGRGQQV